MPRKKKNQEELVRKTAPEVEVKLIDEPKVEQKEVEEQKQELIDDLVVNVDDVDIDKNYIDNTIKKLIFEVSPNNKKTIEINKKQKKQQDIKRISVIKARLKVKPLVSNYRGSRGRKSKAIGFSFKLGGRR